jgi:polyisoprenoid-binding protein YceI
MRVGNELLALAFLAMPALAAEYSLELKPENTKIQWSLGDVLHTVHGTFRLKRGRIDFDTDSGKASGEVVVDVVSGDSGGAARDHRMHAHVLESAKFPEAVFVPGRVEATLAVPGTSTVKLDGTFTIHGVSHQMTMDVQAKATADWMRATIAFDVPFVAWGMKDPSTFILKVNKAVQVSIEAQGMLQKR